MYERFGKYRLLAPIAQGGMAEIFLAKQDGPAGFSKTVVIKRVLQHFGKDDEFVSMFLDEARLAAQLSHPNIVQIFDFGEQDGSYFIAMEYLLGDDVHYLVRAAAKRKEVLPPQVAATITAQACAGLHAAHTAADDIGRPLKIVHRDISPSNLFLTYQGAVKVLDFGIAKAEGRASTTRAGTVKGKFVYMSPEQVQNQPLDARSDVWALGASLHEMLTGQRIFFADNDLAILKKLIQDPIPTPSSINPSVPEELDAVVMKALERDLDQRYESAQAMQAALDEFMATRTYAPAAKLLGSYIQSCVGEERVRTRSQKVAEVLASEASGLRNVPAAPVGFPAPAAPGNGESTGVVSLPGEDGQTGVVAVPGADERTGTVRLEAPGGPATGATEIKGPATAATVLRPSPDVQVETEVRPVLQRPSERSNGPWLALAAALVLVAAVAVVFGDRLVGEKPPAAAPVPASAPTPTPTKPVMPTPPVQAPPAPATPAPTPTAVDMDAGSAVGAPDAGPTADGGPASDAGVVPSPADAGVAAADTRPAAVGARPPTPSPAGAPVPRPSSVAPAPKPAAEPARSGGDFGALTVNCVPYCHIYLDGKDTGMDSPAIAMKVKAGPHKLKVVNPPSGMERELFVQVRAGDDPLVQFIEF